MSLNWDVSAVADHEEVCFYEAEYDDPNGGYVKGDRIIDPVTHSLIWATIAVDLPGITRQNAGEFFARLRFHETVTGAMLIRAEVDGERPKGAAAFITPEEVVAHIGLTANVTPLSRAKWLKRVTENELNHNASRVERLLDTKEAA